MQKWYTVQQLAELLQLSLTKTYELVRSGRIRAAKIGGQYRIPAAALDELFA